ncbi:MAG: heparinase II/III family protein [Phycisphaerae bacterium]|nr:heparinase II/III family protein [Phycisphaerae bacterium]
MKPRSTGILPVRIHGQDAHATGASAPSHNRRRGSNIAPGSIVVLAVAAFATVTPPRIARAAEKQTPPTTRSVGFGVVSRPRQYPPKTSRTYWTNAQISEARRNATKYPAAGKIRDSIVAAADTMLAWPDDVLKARVPTSEVPRAFNVGTVGCPVHGKRIYAKAGTYPWITDPNRPFKIQCPVGKEWYPSNDFYAYFRGEMKDRSLLTGPYADDGWGWVGPDGERYWFVGYACHWGEWRRLILDGLTNLARAYTLTGDKRYAHKAGIILAKIAQTYPAMDYSKQSRYSQISGGGYHGKILNLIWETGTFTNLARDYDAAWDAIGGDKALATLFGCASGDEVRGLIESNLLEDGIDAIFAAKIRGNFGMHQRALATGAVVRQTGPVKEWLDGILTKDTSSHSFVGLNYALYNLVYRDGMPYETSPGYCFGWVSNLFTTATVLAKGGVDLFKLPKMRSLADAPLEMICIDKYTPALGDAGNIWGSLTPDRPGIYQTAYRAYGDPRYARWLERIGATGDDSFKDFDSLFYPAIELKPLASHPTTTPHSRLMDGYGMALLRNRANSMNVSLYYGFRGGHGHFDRLHFDLYACGVPITPDLGYPDFMNGYVPGIYSWSKNTICHNTVTVDKTRQPGNVPGVVQHYVDADELQAVDIDAAGTYPQTSVYRRCLMQIATGPDSGYLVDVFRVSGGEHHAYSLHGPPGKFEIVSGEFAEPAAGTLAGPNVPLGDLYDDPIRGKPGYKGTYYGYTGSGYSHFTGVQRQTGGAFVGMWDRSKTDKAFLRMHVLTQPGQELLLADAQISPVKQKQLIKYVLVRREGKDLDDTFISVIEPYPAAPTITAVQQLDVPAPAVAIEVRRGKLRDVIIQQPDSNVTVDIGKDTQTNAAMMLLRYDATGALRSLVVAGSGEAKAGTARVLARPRVGRVVALDPPKRQVVVSFDRSEGIDPGHPSGQAICFARGKRRVWHPVTRGERVDQGLRLTLGDDLLIGRFHVEAIEGTKIKTHTAMLFTPIYEGSRATDERFGSYVPVASAKEGEILLAEPPPNGLSARHDIWLCDVGPGDAAAFEQVSVGRFGEDR